jgi:uncharacterized membrane protein (Fun14 family)
LAYLQYQQIININWNKLQATSQNTVANATLQLSSRIGNTTDNNNHSAAALATSNFGIPLAGSMAIRFALGFIKG